MTITERIDAITHISEQYQKAAPPAPKSVKIEITARCNFNCAFCARGMSLREQQNMDWGLFTRLLLEMREEGVEEIGLFYLGESFMDKRLEEAIRFAKYEASFPYVFLTTNGSLATPNRVEQCIRNGLDSLKWSLNYADQDQFCEIAQVKPKLYERMLDNLKQAREVRDQIYDQQGLWCGLYASYIAYDGKQGKRMQEMVDWAEQYVDEIYALPLYSQADFRTDAEQARGWNVTAGNRGRLGALRDPIPCWACFTEGHITWDGKLSACCFDHDGRFHMGDLTKQSFMEAWQSAEFCHLRSAHLDKDVTGTVCERCVAYE